MDFIPISFLDGNKAFNEFKRIVEENDEFIMKDAGDYVVFSYTHQMPTTFDVEDPDYKYKIEMRGLTFKRVISKQFGIEVVDGKKVQIPLPDKVEYKCLFRKFHKFFNVNEKSWTHMSNIDLNQPHEITMKEDGSLVTVDLNHDTGLPIFHFKMGINDDLSPLCDEWFVNLPKLDQSYFISMIRDQFLHGVTMLFEFCSNDQRIVLNYPETKLVLIGIRSNATGYYLPSAEKLEHERPGLPHTRWGYDWNATDLFYGGNNIETLIDKLRIKEGIEGVVISFDNGNKYKIKTEEYVLMHRSRDIINNERHMWISILEGKEDDLRPLIDEEHIEILDETILFLNTLMNYIAFSMLTLKLSSQDIECVYNRREVWEFISNSELSKFAGTFMNYYFQDNFDVQDGIKRVVLKNINKDKSFKEFKEYLQVLKE